MTSLFTIYKLPEQEVFEVKFVDISLFYISFVSSSRENHSKIILVCLVLKFA